MQKTAEYYVVVDPHWAPCGHLHVDFVEASACPHRGSAGQILRLRAMGTMRAGYHEEQLGTNCATRSDGPGAAPSVLGHRHRSAGIHSTAIVADSAAIGENVEVGPYAVVGEGVIVGRDSILRAHCIVRAGTVVGQRTTVDSFAILGGDPQDKGFDPAISSGVVVGDHVTLREGVTVHRSTRSGGVTSIADDATLMANSHVGHDGVVGPNAVLANNVMLAGRVEVGAHAFLGGGTGVHQHVRIGEGAMIGGNASITHDIPPFTLATGRNRIHGLNLVGLRRREIPEPVIIDLKRCYRAVFFGITNLRRSAAMALSSGQCGSTEHGRRLLEFFATGMRGFARPGGRH